MRPFCEIIVGKIFPILRALIARELEKMGHTQTEIASRLRTTQPAISQYRRRLRAKNARMLENNSTFMNEVKISAMRIAKDERAYASEMCRLCRFLREQRLICKFCPELEFGDGMCNGCPAS